MVRNKLIAAGLISISALALLGSGFLLGYRVGSMHPQNWIVRGVSNINPASGTVMKNADFSVFWQAWQLIDNEYLRSSSINSQQKVYGSISGLVGSLNDPYSAFFNPQDNQKFQEDIEGNFGGIGAEIGARNNLIVVIAPLKNTPALRVGLKAGDQILSIDGTSTEGMAVDRAVNLIRGPEGTEVTLTIGREGWDRPKDIKIMRAQIVTPTVDFEMKEGKIGYIRLYEFNGNADALFYQAATQLLSQGAKGVVLDLRDDPGGYLHVAVNMAGWFLPRGTLVVSEVSKIRPKEELQANGNEAFAHLPVVVLINKGSASASEILAGALRDERHVELIGEQSFGKGTVQQLEDLKDGSSIKLTVAHWVLPSGQVLEGGGLKPDIEVKITDEDAAAGRDPQLKKALEVMKKMIR